MTQAWLHRDDDTNYCEGDKPYGNYWLSVPQRPGIFYKPQRNPDGSFLQWNLDQAASDAAAAKAQRTIDLTNFCTGDSLAQQLKTASPTQIQTFINNNVTDLTSAKVFLAKLAVIIGFILRNNGF